MFAFFKGAIHEYENKLEIGDMLGPIISASYPSRNLISMDHLNVSSPIRIYI